MLELSDDQIKEMLRLMDQDSPAHEALTLEVDIQQTSTKLERLRLEHELLVRELRRAEDEYDTGQNRVIDEMFAVDNEMQKLQEYLDDIIPESLFPRYVFTGDPKENQYDPQAAADYIEEIKQSFPDEYPKMREASNRLEQLYLREKQLSHESAQLHPDGPLSGDENHPLNVDIIKAVSAVTESNKHLTDVDKRLQGLVAQRAALSNRAEQVPRSSTIDTGDALTSNFIQVNLDGTTPTQKVVKDTEGELRDFAQQRAVNDALFKRLQEKGKTRTTYIKYNKNRTEQLKKLGGDPRFQLGKQTLNHAHNANGLVQQTFNLYTKNIHARQMLALRGGLVTRWPREKVQFIVIDRLNPEGNTIEVMFLKNQKVAEITIEVDPNDKNDKWVISTCKSVDPAWPKFESSTPGVPSGLSQRLDNEETIDESIHNLVKYNGDISRFMKQNSDDATS